MVDGEVLCPAESKDLWAKFFEAQTSLEGPVSSSELLHRMRASTLDMGTSAVSKPSHLGGCPFPGSDVSLPDGFHPPAAVGSQVEVKLGSSKPKVDAREYGIVEGPLVRSPNWLKRRPHSTKMQRLPR